MGTYSSGELGLEATAALPQLVLGGSLSRLSRLLSAPHHGTRVIFDKLHIDHREVDVAVRGRLAREMQNPSLGNDKIFPLQDIREEALPSCGGPAQHGEGPGRELVSLPQPGSCSLGALVQELCVVFLSRGVVDAERTLEDAKTRIVALRGKLYELSLERDQTFERLNVPLEQRELFTALARALEHPEGIDGRDEGAMEPGESACVIMGKVLGGANEEWCCGGTFQDAEATYGNARGSPLPRKGSRSPGMASPPSRLQPPKAGRRRRSLVSSPVCSSPRGALSGSLSSLPPPQRRRLFHSSPPPGSSAEPRRKPSESHRDGGCTVLRAYTIGAEARDRTGKGSTLVAVDSRPVADGRRVDGPAQVNTEDRSKETGMSKGESLGDVREWSRKRLVQEVGVLRTHRDALTRSLVLAEKEKADRLGSEALEVERLTQEIESLQRESDAVREKHDGRRQRREQATVCLEQELSTVRRPARIPEEESGAKGSAQEKVEDLAYENSGTVQGVMGLEGRSNLLVAENERLAHHLAELVSENEMLRARASKVGASGEVAADANIDHPKDGAAVYRDAAESAPTIREFELGLPRDGEHPGTIPAEVTETKTGGAEIVNRRVSALPDVDVDPSLKERPSRKKRVESGGSHGACPGAGRETGDEAMSTSVESPRGVGIGTTATELVDSGVRTPARKRQVAVDPQAESLVFDKAGLCDLGAPEEELRASVRTLERRVEEAQKEVADLERLRGIERDEASSKETRLEDALRGAQAEKADLARAFREAEAKTSDTLVATRAELSSSRRALEECRTLVVEQTRELHALRKEAEETTRTVASEALASAEIVATAVKERMGMIRKLEERIGRRPTEERSIAHAVAAARKEEQAKMAVVAEEATTAERARSRCAAELVLAKQEKSSLVEEMKQLRVSFATLKGEKFEGDRAVRTLEEAQEEYLATIGSLERNLASQQEQLASMVTGREDLEKRLAVAEDATSSVAAALDEERAAAEEKLAALVRSHEERIRDAKEGARREMEGAAAELSAVEGELAAALERSERHEEQVVSVVAERRELERQLRVAREAVASISAALGEERGRMAEQRRLEVERLESLARSSEEEVRQATERARGEVEAATAAASAAKEELAAALEKSAARKGQLASMVSERQELEDRLGAARDTAVRVAAELDEERGRTAEKERLAVERLGALTRSNEEKVEEARRTARGEVEAMKKELEVALERSAAHEGQLAVMVTEREDLGNELADAELAAAKAIAALDEERGLRATQERLSDERLGQVRSSRGESVREARLAARGELQALGGQEGGMTVPATFAGAEARVGDEVQGPSHGLEREAGHHHHHLTAAALETVRKCGEEVPDARRALKRHGLSTVGDDSGEQSVCTPPRKVTMSPKYNTPGCFAGEGQARHGIYEGDFFPEAWTSWDSSAEGDMGSLGRAGAPVARRDESGGRMGRERGRIRAVIYSLGEAVGSARDEASALTRRVGRLRAELREAEHRGDEMEAAAATARAAAGMAEKALKASKMEVEAAISARQETESRARAAEQRESERVSVLAGEIQMARDEVSVERERVADAKAEVCKLREQVGDANKRVALLEDRVAVSAADLRTAEAQRAQTQLALLRGLARDEISDERCRWSGTDPGIVQSVDGNSHGRRGEYRMHARSVLASTAPKTIGVLDGRVAGDLSCGKQDDLNGLRGEVETLRERLAESLEHHMELVRASEESLAVANRKRDALVRKVAAAGTLASACCRWRGIRAGREAALDAASRLALLRRCFWSLRKEALRSSRDRTLRQHERMKRWVREGVGAAGDELLQMIKSRKLRDRQDLEGVVAAGGGTMSHGSEM